MSAPDNAASRIRAISGLAPDNNDAREIFSRGKLMKAMYPLL